jgi:hypothetical protein
MYMKTKENDKKSGSADHRFCGLRLFHGRWGGPRTANTAVRATPKSGEQSENVYENKGQVQKVEKSRSGGPEEDDKPLVGGRKLAAGSSTPQFLDHKIERTNRECL